MKSTNALDWACDLEKSGMPNEQAVAVAQVFHESHETLMENMREMFAEQAKSLNARFESLDKAVGKLGGEIQRVEGKLGGEIRRVEDKLESKHRWVIGLIIGVNGLAIGVIGLMVGAVLQMLSQTS